MVDDISTTGTRDAIRGQFKIGSSPDNLIPPKNIIKTIHAAKAVYFKFREKHIKRIALYASIEGLLSGNPPYDTVELQQNGLGHIANFNTLDGRALYERGALAYWNLLNHTETLVNFELNYPDALGQRPELVEYADIMAREWDTVIREWPSFSTLMNMLSAQLIKFGISPVIWPDERDFRWRVVELAKFFVQDQAQSDIAQLTSVCVESVFTAQYLFEVYEQFKGKKQKDIPWDLEEIAQLLFHFANTNTGEGKIENFMDLQLKFQNGDLSYDEVYTDDIRLVSLLYKEYDGEISHYMFHPHFDTGKFLYFADRQYKNLQEAMVIFTASPGEFTIHSNRGLGHKIYSMTQAQNQLDCSMVDMARLSSTPFLKGLSVGSRDFEAIRVIPGVPTNIGSAEFIQTNFGANINQLIGLSQYMTNKIQYNAANSGDDPSIPDMDKGSISPTEVRTRSYKEFGVLKNNIAHFYNQFDVVIRVMVSKMLHCKKGWPGYEYCQEWKENCMAKGVPKEVFDTGNVGITGLPRHLKAKASRVAGDGSTLARIMGLQELGNIAADFGPREAAEYRRQWILATMGADYVPAFMQSSDDIDERAGGASLAGVENAVMQEGKSAIFSADNEHRSHLVTHLALGTETIQAIQQQQLNPIEADRVFNVLIPHIEEHYNFLSQSPFAETFISKIQKAVKQVAEYGRLNRKNAGKMLQAQLKREQKAKEDQQKVMSDADRKDYQAQRDEARKDYKVRETVERAKEANETRGEVAREKIRRDADNDRLKIKLDAKNKAKDTDVPDPAQALKDMQGNTPAPYDIEGS